MAKKYIVPEGMITAVVGAQNANRTLHDVVPNRNHIERDLEAAIRWQAENPPVPEEVVGCSDLLPTSFANVTAVEAQIRILEAYRRGKKSRESL